MLRGRRIVFGKLSLIDNIRVISRNYVTGRINESG